MASRVETGVKKETVKWYEIYHEISVKLLKEHERWSKRKKNSGEELYKLLLKSTPFKNQNAWIQKFSQKFGVKSIDPVHLFASFNGSKTKHENRIEKIKCILDVLGISHNFEEIDFEGCPAPNTVRILSVRQTNSQKEIWDMFGRVVRFGADGLKEIDFNRSVNWYGLNLASITIFLFWVGSESFLPLDHNVRSFIVGSRILDEAPNDYDSYMESLKLISKSNYESNDLYGNLGIFREIALISYDTITKGQKESKYTKEFWTLIEEGQKKPGEHQPVSVDQPKSIKNEFGNIAESAKIGLKLVAIKPRKNCAEKYLNILKRGTTYYFENKFAVGNTFVKYDTTDHFQNFNLFGGTEHELKINVSAIVGKNGSGKSTIIDLLFRVINNISFTFKKELRTSELTKEPGLFVDFYFIQSGILYCIILQKNGIFIQEYSYQKDRFTKSGKRREFAFTDFFKFFYTIGVNYSLYWKFRLN